MVKWNWRKSRIIFPRENEHLVAVELEHLWCINFISVKLFECYYGPLVRFVDTGWRYHKGDMNCSYYYYYCSLVQRKQQY